MTGLQILNGRYRLEAEIGRGGMGVVYRGTDSLAGRTVAIKLLPPSLAEDQNLLARFRNEVVNTGQLDHPNIAKVYDVGEADGAYYYVMELVDGFDLRSSMSQHGRYSVNEATVWLDQIASALDHAHQKGIVHRDIKPENILIDRSGSVRIVDFGIAKAVGATRLTGGMIGTPEYISPEQARGEVTCGAADQYSMAVMAYEMLTGSSPFRTDTSEPWAVISKHISEPPPDPQQLAPDIPDSTASALMRALEKSPADRFDTCQQFVEALNGEYVFAPVRRAATPHQRSPLRVLLAFCLILFVAGLVLIMRPQTQSQPGVVSPPPPTTTASPLDNSHVTEFVRNTWFPAWTSRQIGPLGRCYDNDKFVGHDYASRTSYTTLTFDSYLLQWLSRSDLSTARLTSVRVSVIDQGHAKAFVSIGAGGSESLRRLTIDRRQDGSLVIAHEDSAPTSVSLDGLE